MAFLKRLLKVKTIDLTRREDPIIAFGLIGDERRLNARVTRNAKASAVRQKRPATLTLYDVLTKAPVALNN